MRSALVTLLLGSLVGIDGTLRGMAAAARKLALPLDVVVVVPDGTPDADDGIRRIRYRPWQRLARAQRMFRYRILAETLPDDYDVVFLRYPISLDLDPTAIFRSRRPRRIATIHHTKEIEEIASGPRSASVFARAALERVMGRRVLSRVDGIVGVTDEIRRYELARAGREKPSSVMSNGVDVEAVPFTRFTPFDGTTLRIVLVASAIAPWHGWDRLERALDRHRGRRVVVDAVGKFGREAGFTQLLPSAEIRYHGLLQRDALSHVLKNANVAVSSLAMHRAGLREGCVLKTREYAARGLPFVYAYEDGDLAAADPFCLRLPDDEEPVSLEAIFAFAERTARDPDVSERARAAAKTRMDWTIKMNGLHAFGEAIA